MNRVIVALLCVACTIVHGADASTTRPALTPEQAQKVEAAKAAALKDPAVKAATDKAAAARKAYQSARDSTSPEDSRAARLAFVEAREEADRATRAAMIAADPTIAALLDPVSERATPATTKPVPGPAAPAAPAPTADAQRLEAARAAALADPAVKPVQERYNAARKAYQADRAKFPSDRNKDVALAFRKATQELDEAVHKAMIEKDPSIAPLLDRRMNEGE